MRSVAPAAPRPWRGPTSAAPQRNTGCTATARTHGGANLPTSKRVGRRTSASTNWPIWYAT